VFGFGVSYFLPAARSPQPQPPSPQRAAAPLARWPAAARSNAGAGAGALLGHVLTFVCLICCSSLVLVPRPTSCDSDRDQRSSEA
jgi:hypothetical protein